MILPGGILAEQLAAGAFHASGGGSICVEKDDDIRGFIGMMENYIAGIFVDEKFRSCGIGRELLDYAKSVKKELSLSVYKKNQAAARFYLLQWI